MKAVIRIASPLVLSLAVALVFATNARGASVVQVDALGKTWDVSYVYGTWIELEDLLTSQPWWELGCCGEGSVQEFLYEADLGGINRPNSINGAPWFNYDLDLSATPFFAWSDNSLAWGDLTQSQVAMAMSWGNGWLDGFVVVGQAQAVHWAVATPHAVPIPGTLGLLGIGLAGLGFVRRKADIKDRQSISFQMQHTFSVKEDQDG